MLKKSGEIMPTDNNLPIAVEMYLDLINRCLSMLDGIDSSDPLGVALREKIDSYFDCVESYMEQAIQKENI